jgi:hypothetical protein
VLGSSVVAAIVSGWMPVLLARRRLRVEQTFDDRVRARNSHAEAASELAEEAAAVYELLDNIANAVLAHGVDYYPPQGVQAGNLTDFAGEASRRLRTIWTRHPTHAVRLAARDFQRHLESTYGEPDPEGGLRIPREGDSFLLDDVERAEALIELLHSPPEPTFDASRATDARVREIMARRTLLAGCFLVVASVLWVALEAG